MLFCAYFLNAFFPLLYKLKLTQHKLKLTWALELVSLV